MNNGWTEWDGLVNGNRTRELGKLVFCFEFGMADEKERKTERKQAKVVSV